MSNSKKIPCRVCQKKTVKQSQELSKKYREPRMSKQIKERDSPDFEERWFPIQKINKIDGQIQRALRKHISNVKFKENTMQSLPEKTVKHSQPRSNWVKTQRTKNGKANKRERDSPDFEERCQNEAEEIREKSKETEIHQNLKRC